MQTSRSANLYLACTPLQILNAAEARDRFHPDDDNFLVVFHSPRSSKKQARLAELADDAIDHHWTRTWNLRLTRISQLLFPFTARKLRQQIGHCQSLWTGGFQTQQRHLLHSIPHNQLIVFDGGAGVLQSAVNSWRLSGNPLTLPQTTYPRTKHQPAGPQQSEILHQLRSRYASGIRHHQ